MGSIKFTNNAKTKLAAGISATDTVLTVTTTTGAKLPTLPGGNGDYCVLTLEDSAGNREFVKVSKRIADTCGDGTYPCVRGYWGSTARVWPSGVTVDIRWSANAIQEYLQALSGRYLGAQTGAPTADIFGGALKAGDLYLENGTGLLMKYTGAAWVNGISIANYLPLSGGTMTGALALAADAAASMQAVTLQQMQAGDASVLGVANAAGTAAAAAQTTANAAQTTANSALPKAGGAMTGALVLAADAVSAMQAVTKQQMEAADAQSTPPGAIQYFARSTAPAGWLKANGAAVSRTAYAALWSVAQASGMMASSAEDWTTNPGKFYIGDGSATFNIPDLRGEFIRAWDDGRGVDTGRAFGSSQADDLKSHTHTYPVAISSSGGSAAPGAAGGGNANTGSAGGSETRPRNIALLVCIKY